MIGRWGAAEGMGRCEAMRNGLLHWYSGKNWPSGTFSGLNRSAPERTNMRPYLRATIAGVAAALAFTFGIANSAQAETSDDSKPSFKTCANLDGWYANPDEQEDLPTPTEDGLLFEAKDLIHHQTSPLALADVKGGTFEATTAGKVVFKMETTNPYSTIIQNADGKFWSSRLALSAPGGQNNPVSTVTDMIGSETKTGNPKYTNDTHVNTFGVGYWVAEGSTVVSSISFHGTKYPLTCKPAPTTQPTTTPATTKPTTSAPATTKPTSSPSGSKSSSATPGAVVTGDAGPSLPVTGPSIGWVAATGGAVLVLGAALLILSRRRKAAFSVE